MALPSVLILDVNETLSDMGAMAQRFAEVGAPRGLAATWFAAILRDGMALAASGGSATFAQLAADHARRMLGGVDLAPQGPAGSLGSAVDHVLAGFTTLEVHPDVAPGLRALAEDGHRIATLSNGAASVARGLLERAGLGDVVELTLSVEAVGVWKPAAAAYHYACAELGVGPAGAMLVAVHPWDTDGAARAGLASAWIDRVGAAADYPAYFIEPTVRADSFVDLAAALQR